MKKQQEKRIRQWCVDNNWTDLFICENKFYAFPPNAVIPLPVPLEENQLNYKRGRCNQSFWLAVTIDIFISIPKRITTLTNTISTIKLVHPMTWNPKLELSSINDTRVPALAEKNPATPPINHDTRTSKIAQRLCSPACA